MTKSVKRYQEAAKNGDVVAMYELGDYFANLVPPVRT